MKDHDASLRHMVYSCFVWNILPFSDLNDPSNLSLGYPTHWSVKLTLGGYIPLQTVYFSSNHERSVNSKVHHLSLHLPGAGSVKHTKCPHPIKCCLKATPNTLYTCTDNFLPKICQTQTSSSTHKTNKAA